jgi:hypothetical protein
MKEIGLVTWWSLASHTYSYPPAHFREFFVLIDLDDSMRRRVQTNSTCDPMTLQRILVTVEFTIIDRHDDAVSLKDWPRDSRYFWLGCSRSGKDDFGRSLSNTLRLPLWPADSRWHFDELNVGIRIRPRTAIFNITARGRRRSHVLLL